MEVRWTREGWREDRVMEKQSSRIEYREREREAEGKRGRGRDRARERIRMREVYV